MKTESGSTPSRLSAGSDVLRGASVVTVETAAVVGLELSGHPALLVNVQT
jgi:hypothetical protein